MNYDPEIAALEAAVTSEWGVTQDNSETALIHEPCDQIAGWFDGGSLNDLLLWVADSVRSHTCRVTETP
jgi:hypothetical protein